MACEICFDAICHFFWHTVQPKLVVICRLTAVLLGVLLVLMLLAVLLLKKYCPVVHNSDFLFVFFD